MFSCYFPCLTTILDIFGEWVNETTNNFANIGAKNQC